MPCTSCHLPGWHLSEGDLARLQRRWSGGSFGLDSETAAFHDRAEETVDLVRAHPLGLGQPPAVSGRPTQTAHAAAADAEAPSQQGSRLPVSWGSSSSSRKSSSLAGSKGAGVVREAAGQAARLLFGASLVSLASCLAAADVAWFWSRSLVQGLWAGPLTSAADGARRGLDSAVGAVVRPWAWLFGWLFVE
jgi:hypothetical protein